MTKQESMKKLLNSERIYVIFSQRTNMPFLVCDPETMDDQIYVYFTEEEAKKEAKHLAESGDSCGIFVLAKKGLTAFCMNLYALGVNCIVTGYGTGDCQSIQLEEFMTRKANNPDKFDIRRVENPALNLTMHYFMQELASKNTDMKAAKELEQEMLAHFQEAKFLVPFQKDKKGIFLVKDDKKFQPLFTDYFEYDKFDREKKFMVIPVDARVLIKNFPKEAFGLVINPNGANAMLNLNVAKK